MLCLAVHLHPSTRRVLSDILPSYTKGNLAPIAAWADRVRPYYPWANTLHYATPIDPEHPPQDCTFEGAFKSERNVLAGWLSMSGRSRLAEEKFPQRYTTTLFESRLTAMISTFVS